MSARQVVGERQDWCILIQEAIRDRLKGEVTVIHIVMILGPMEIGRINWG
jgi:hypothetical protein